jgi:hypothetical protein
MGNWKEVSRGSVVARIVTIVLVVIAVAVVIFIIAQMQGLQPFTKLAATAAAAAKAVQATTKKGPTEVLREEVKRKDALPADERPRAAQGPSATRQAAPSDASIDRRLEVAVETAKMNVRNAVSTPMERRAALERAPQPANRKVSLSAPASATQLRGEVQTVELDSYWDLFTPKEDTMREYGVTEDELAALVEQCRKEGAYEVEKAPTTLHFNMAKFEEANDAMQDYMDGAFVHRRSYEDGLIVQLYREGELV